MSELKPFDDKLAALIASLSPASRRKMAAEIAKQLRASQQQRIKRQRAPSGIPYASRRQPVRGKKGRVKRAMFAKLRTNRYMKAKGSNDDAVVEFVGRVQRMARVHQDGLKDRPTRYSKEVRYDVRELLGFSEADRQIVEDVVISHFADN
ncbi:MAG: phage virion morphogenesis protein [Serratia liquefaciens]|jgi:phage virion morphogenesis protein|nr:phage virion morphogenesis protein [Serratia liquefaciens]MCI1215579.1 phage virion morphogenesis protein [Serratia liquefaciens]MCI1233908.1 phage virion morphogenesis protein [Serratia liquefaciens]MCI1249490.1 phage virion morphogenesis protein [Serratia liquefaciens]MCI1806880.1 phage virion morphogenesis protein [Serratia liquefaciens]